jgi:glycosyltransferase involved in cell wall biosynthesis
MYKGQKIAVVVPAYKEESQIEMVIDTMPAFVDEIIIVDDASPDKTVEVVRACMTTNPKVSLVAREKMGAWALPLKVDIKPLLMERMMSPL